MVFEEMNQLAQCVFVGTEGVDRVEAVRAQQAQRAAPVFIQRETIQKGSLAILAEVISQNCRWLVEALGANRDAGNVAERLATDAAIVGEQLLKKAAKSPFCERQNGPADIGQQGT